MFKTIGYLIEAVSYMKSYRLLYDQMLKVALGVLVYDHSNKEFRIFIRMDRRLRLYPLPFCDYISKWGMYALDAKESLMWVRERIIPPNRANIGAILHELGLREYDEWVMLDSNNGLSCQDHIIMRKLNDKQLRWYAGRFHITELK